VSELQLALGALAALVLLAIWGHGRWQERRLLQRLRERMHGGVGDALLAQRPSPIPLHPARPPVPAAEPPRPGGRPGPAPREIEGGDPEEEPVEATSEALRLQALHIPDWEEDPLLDCSLELRCSRAVDGVAVIDAVTPLATPDWPLPVHFVVWDARHRQWVLPDRFGYYSDALASIQLASRSGALDADVLRRFVLTVREVARVLDADVDSPDEARILEQARELDRLCARFDVRIGLNVRPGAGAWTGPQVRSCVQDLGWRGTGPQRWVMAGPDERPRFVLQADAPSPSQLGLELDVALSPDGVQSLPLMTECARALANSLSGIVVDDNGRPIDEGSMRAVQEQLARVYEEMRGAGLEPGSERAWRLYGAG